MGTSNLVIVLPEAIALIFNGAEEPWIREEPDWIYVSVASFVNLKTDPDCVGLNRVFNTVIGRFIWVPGTSTVTNDDDVIPCGV